MVATERGSCVISNSDASQRSEPESIEHLRRQTGKSF
jgi:hypothetical protein